MTNIEEKVEALIEPIIESLGYELYDVQYVKEGKNYFLRIFIDKDDGIDIDDCEKVNDNITELLDEADYIKEAYFLEVSSSGVERTLRKDKHFNRYLGEKIEVKLYKPLDGKKEIQGILEGFNENEININVQETINIPRNTIALIKTIYDWE